MAGNNVYVQGSYIDVHDNENVYLSVDKAKVTVGDNKALEQVTPEETDNIIVAKLKPMFFGDEEETRAFLERIMDAEPTQITSIVREMVAEKKLSGISCHRPLWQVLHDYGIYEKSESNWNMQIK